MAAEDHAISEGKGVTDDCLVHLRQGERADSRGGRWCQHYHPDKTQVDRVWQVGSCQIICIVVLSERRVQE